MVVNLDTAKHAGSHWVTMFAFNRGHVMYFDSYGRDPNYHIVKYLLNFIKVTRNVRPFQSLISTVCGHYCVYVLYFMSLGVNFDQVIKSLRCNDNPDMLVRKFVSNFFRK